MGLRADTVVVRTPFEAFTVGLGRAGGARTPEERELASWAARQFRLGIELGDRTVLDAALALERLLDGGIAPPTLADRVPRPDGSFGGLAARLETALLSGRLVIERERLQSLTDRPPSDFPELPPLPPAAREAATTTFEVRFLDEIGKPISGISAEFSADGPKTRTSNGAGIALLDGLQSSSASVTVADPSALAELLDPRWETFRSGKAPQESNTQEVVFLGEELGPFKLKAELPNTVVIRPPKGKLFAELWDKSGRARHANRTYQISGPQSFEGKTDANGTLLHEVVFPGNYQLSLALDFFEENDPDRAMDIVESPLVVLEPAIAQPEVRMLGAVPRSVLARLQLFFNTNKAFLLPTALPSVKKLRRLYLGNAPCKLLVVGHADTTAGPAYNDKLSLSRANAIIAYLKDDVEAWFALYGQGVDAKQRWGKVEDKLMIRAMPDFPFKPKGEDAVKWYQRTRNLEIDGVAGDKTRHALIEEYMTLDGASLADFAGDIEAVAHGCGENFPLDDSGEALDEAPADNKRDRIDRRVELFFFDLEFGITPPPPGANSKPGSPEYPLWRKRVVETVELEAGDPDAPEVTFVELSDAHFRSGSAVLLPEGEAPDAKGGHRSLTTVGLVAQALRFNDEHDGRRVFVAGHTDTTAGDDLNDELSRERAKLSLAILVGDRDTFKSLAHKRNKPADINQILSWVQQALPDLKFRCDPGKITSVVDSTKVRAFQEDFNRNKQTLGSSAADLGIDGSVGELTWGAFFDCYEFALQEELGENAAGVAALRKRLTFVDENRKALGFGERFPIEELGVDNFRSQTNRRVEILFFEQGEEPDLAAAEADPETSELYLTGFFQRTPLPPMLSAKPWKASWDAPTTSMLETRNLLLDAPGLPSGEPLTFTITALGFGAAGSLAVAASEGAASASFDDWGAMEGIAFQGLTEEFPSVEFVFSVEGGGRLVTSTPVLYEDRAFLRLVLKTADGDVNLADEPFVLASPWGRREGKTDAQAILDQAGLPPGGVSIVVRGHTLAHFGILESGADLDGS